MVKACEPFKNHFGFANRSSRPGDGEVPVVVPKVEERRLDLGAEKTQVKIWGVIRLEISYEIIVKFYADESFFNHKRNIDLALQNIKKEIDMYKKHLWIPC